VVALDGGLAASLSRPDARALEANFKRLQAVSQRLEASQRMFQESAATERASAQKLAKQRQEVAARQALVRSKQLLAQADHVSANLGLVYNQLMLLSQAQLNYDMVTTLQEANAALQTMCRASNLSPDKVSDITAELKTRAEQMNTINDALTNATAVGAPVFDTKELDDELRALVAEPVEDTPVVATNVAAAAAAALGAESSTPSELPPVYDTDDTSMEELAHALGAAAVATKAAARSLPRQSPAATAAAAKLPRPKQAVRATVATPVANPPRSLVFVSTSQH
jgi:hypothetical protein